MTRPADPPARTGGGDTTDDLELIEACLDGDERAWKTLVERYGRLVYSIPHRYRLDDAAADDVFQEVFSILFRQLPKIRRRTGLPKWIMTTTHRVCRQWARRARRAGELPAEVERTGPPPPEELARDEDRHRVREALARLGGRCETLLLALYASPGEASYEQIARQLNLPVGSIGPTRARCLRKLLELMEGSEVEDEP